MDNMPSIYVINIYFRLENNRIDLAEHTGTHVDAPVHVANEAGHWKNHQIPIERLAGPGVVIDVKAKAAADRDYRVTVDDLNVWESKYGRIPYGAVVLMNSGWGQYYPNYTAVFSSNNLTDPTTYHFPSWHEDAVQWLISSRVVYCVGVDTPSTDYGQSKTYPAHTLLSDANIIGIESVAYIDRLPETGATVFVSLMKIRDGSGGPIRMFATLPEHDGKDEANTAVTKAFSPVLHIFWLLLLGLFHF